VEQGLDAEQVLHILSSVEPLPGLGPAGFYNLEFRFPVAQNVGIDTDKAADLADAKVHPIGYFRCPGWG
jgi:hypothetical protein